MTALPPPKPNLYSKIGAEIGVVYGLASVMAIGVGALILFPALGFTLGKLVELFLD